MRRTRSNCRRGAWLLLATGFLISGVLLVAPSAFSDDDVKAAERSALRKDKDYARLFHDGKEFLALPPEKQEAMRKLHEDLERLPAAERDKLKDVLRRYAEWLDRLPEAERHTVQNATDDKARLQIIKDMREKEWIGHQPRATQHYLAKLPKTKSDVARAAAVYYVWIGLPRIPRLLAAAAAVAEKPVELRDFAIRRIKKEDSRTARNWVVAGRHWNELTTADAKRPTLPKRAADFDGKDSKELSVFVKEYLIPALTSEEKERLAKADGHWPDYPITLVELADKYPMALPRRNGPTSWKDLPADIRDLKKGLKGAGKKGANLETFYAAKKSDIETRLAKIPLRNSSDATKFASAVVTFAHTGKKGAVSRFPHELWASKPDDMSPPMKAFLDKQSPFWTSLKEDEQLELLRAQEKWPEYPLKVKALAAKYGFNPPWFTLPDIGNKNDAWDKYRVKPLYKSEAPLVPRFLHDPVAQELVIMRRAEPGQS
jgi:hypothetical protein